MPFAFTQWYWLLLLPPLCYFFWYAAQHTITDITTGRKRFSLLLRCLLITLLVLALAGLELQKSSKTLTVVFLADASRSVGKAGRTAEETFIHQALQYMHPGDRAALITFARSPQINSLPAHALHTSGLQHGGSMEATNIARAIAQGRALLQNKKTGRRMVLLSDGNETNGDALQQTASLNAANIHLDTVTIDPKLHQEALVESMTLPQQVKIGQPFTIRVVLRSLTSQQAALSLSRNSKPAGSPIQVALHPGDNLVRVQQTIAQPGAYRYQAELNAPQDTYPQNNRGEGYVWVRGIPTVLYVADSSQLTAFLRRTLAAQHLRVEYAPPSALPSSPAALQGFDAVFLSNVAAYNLTNQQMTALQHACRDFGMGLGMIGGDQSFGAGYYRGTPLEKALPVSMDVKQQKKLPSVAVALVIEDLEIESSVNMSIEAAKAVVDLLEPIDQVGVLDCNGFGYFGGNSSSPGGTWRIPMQHVVHPNAIKNEMQNLTGMGDPPTYDPYLLEAARVLNNTDAKIKHIIFLGDGDAIYESDQKTITRDIQRINNMGITVSTIASGADSQGQTFLAYIAKLGHGQAYVADEESQLPRLLLKDAETVSQPPIVEEPFLPVRMPDDRVLKGIAFHSAPPLLGYDVVSAKPDASVSLMDARPDRENPIFAEWRYGLGRSVAFMSDDRAKWAVQWLNWPGYASFWAQTVRWTLRPYHPGQYDTSVQMKKGRGHIVVDAISSSGQYVNHLQMSALVLPPHQSSESSHTVRVPMHQTGPGLYEGWFDANGTGTWLVNVLQRSPNKAGTQRSTPVGISVAYPSEYRSVQPNRILMQHLAHADMGRTDPAPQAVFGMQRPAAYTHYSLHQALLLAALLLLPLDIAVRRLAFGRQEMERLTALLRRKTAAAPEKAATPELARLKSRREQTVRLRTTEHTPADSPAGKRQGTMVDASRKTDPKNAEAVQVEAVSPENTLQQEESGMSRLRAAKKRASVRNERNQNEEEQQ